MNEQAHLNYEELAGLLKKFNSFLRILRSKIYPILKNFVEYTILRLLGLELIFGPKTD